MRIRSILVLFAILLALGGYFYFSHQPAPPAKQEPRRYAWLINMDDITNITISLPREGKSESFVKIPNGDKFPWFFDDANHSAIDTKRWGGGIPLLLSGPGVERIISTNTSDTKLAEYGILEPRMVVRLTLTNGHKMDIQVGDYTPDGQGFYVLAPRTRDIATVHYSWYQVIERLVVSPPYVSTDTTKP